MFSISFEWFFFVLRFLPYLLRVTLEKKKSVCIGGRELYKKNKPWGWRESSMVKNGLLLQRTWTPFSAPLLGSSQSPACNCSSKASDASEKEEVAWDPHRSPPTAVPLNSILCLCPPFLVSPQPPPGQLSWPLWSYFHPRQSSQVFGRDFWSWIYQGRRKSLCCAVKLCMGVSHCEAPCKSALLLRQCDLSLTVSWVQVRWVCFVCLLVWGCAQVYNRLPFWILGWQWPQRFWYARPEDH